MMEDGQSENELDNFLERFRELGLSPSHDGEEWPTRRKRSAPRLKVSLPATEDTAASSLLELLKNAFANRALPAEALNDLPENARQRLLTALSGKFSLAEAEGPPRLRRPRKSEEELKLVVKRGMRSLFLRFKADRQHFVCGRKELDKLEFYRHFFAAAAEAQGLSLEHYLLPASKLQRGGQGLRLEKTVTASYLLRLVKASDFRAQLEEYLDRRFLRDYQLARDGKLLRIARLIAADGRDSFQLPWSDEELATARDNVLRLIASPAAQPL